MSFVSTLTPTSTLLLVNDTPCLESTSVSHAEPALPTHNATYSANIFSPFASTIPFIVPSSTINSSTVVANKKSIRGFISS